MEITEILIWIGGFLVIWYFALYPLYVDLIKAPAVELMICKKCMTSLEQRVWYLEGLCEAHGIDHGGDDE